MSGNWKRNLDRVLQEGEMVCLVFTTALLFVIEACFAYWLNHIQLPDRPFAASGFLAMPPWYRKPRFEVTLMLTSPPECCSPCAVDCGRFGGLVTRLPLAKSSRSSVGESTRQPPWRLSQASIWLWRRGCAD